jgi:DnaJ like chaperone protein
LIDLLEGLFTIAIADGQYHPNEDAFLAEVARIFGLGDPCFRSLRARFVEGAPRDPYEVLGVPMNASLEEIRAAWKQAVRDSHPDRLVARGVPPEAVALASRRLIDINAAWEEINGKRAA